MVQPRFGTRLIREIESVCPVSSRQAADNQLFCSLSGVITLIHGAGDLVLPGATVRRLDKGHRLYFIEEYSAGKIHGGIRLKACLVLILERPGYLALNKTKPRYHEFWPGDG
jgi:hypothetical protein